MSNCPCGAGRIESVPWALRLPVEALQIPDKKPSGYFQMFYSHQAFDSKVIAKKISVIPYC